MPSKAGPVAAILLAAGESARLGRPKQLLPFRGGTLLRHTAETVLASGCDRVFVVVGASHERMRSELGGLDVGVVVNAEWQEGLGASIRCGVHAMMRESGAWSGAMLLLADQFRVAPRHLQQMLVLFRNTDREIVAACCDGHTGPPAVLGASLFSRLLALRGAHGARGIIGSMRDDTILFDLPEAAFDVDVDGDATRLVTDPIP